MNKIFISCKSCGGYEGDCHPGKGPHAYEVKCNACNKHVKWASALDVVDFKPKQLESMFKEEELLAISAAKNGNFNLFMAHCRKRDKIIETLNA